MNQDVGGANLQVYPTGFMVSTCVTLRTSKLSMSHPGSAGFQPAFSDIRIRIPHQLAGRDAGAPRFRVPMCVHFWRSRISMNRRVGCVTPCAPARAWCGLGDVRGAQRTALPTRLRFMVPMCVPYLWSKLSTDPIQSQAPEPGRHPPFDFGFRISISAFRF